MTSEEVLNIFKETGALLEGHFVLTSGYHSPHYFQCAKVLQYPQNNVLFSKMISEYFINDDIDVVISPAIGGIVLGTEVGRQMDKKTIFTERENNVMTMRRGFDLKEGENVLICEDVVTTGGSVFEIIKIVNERKANLKGVGFIVDRSNGKIDFGVKQISLSKIEVIRFAENEIPEWLEKIPVTKPGSRKLKI